MNALPIPFTDPMVLAILRVIKELRGFGRITEFQRSTTPGYDWTFRDKRLLWHDITHQTLMERCPYGRPGDLLYVREAHDLIRFQGQPDGRVIEVDYRATHTDGTRMSDLHGTRKWRPNIFHHREHSRITLVVEDIQVERLQDISEADARAEGCDNSTSEAALAVGWYEKPRRAFLRLWEQINGPGSWSDNPYVWPITFKPVLENVDDYIQRLSDHNTEHL